MLPDQSCLAAVSEFSTDAVLLLTRAGVILWASPSTGDVLGFEPDVVVGTQARDLIIADDLDAWGATVAQLMQQPGVPFSGSYRCRHRDGSVRWTYAIARNLLDEPRVRAVLVCFRDITPARETEARLQANEQRYRQLFAEATDIVFEVQAAEAKYRSLVEQSLFAVFIMQDERLVYVNPKGAELLGYTLDELLAMAPPLKIVAEADRSYVREQLDRLGRGVMSVHFVARATRKDGTYVQGEVNCSLSEYGGKPAIFSTVMDITERLRLEEQVRQAQKMEAIGRLAGGIAHDFNNLLTAIRGNAELLSHRLKDDPARAAEVDEILFASDRAAAMTRQLLAFSRKQEIASVSLDVNELVDNVARMARRLIGPDILLETQTDKQLRRVLADAAQIEQMLLNLIVNARDALPEGGRIRVRTSNVDLREGTPEATRTGLLPGEYVVLDVADDGIGMDQATQARIFEPFFTTKEPGRGTGLGLSTLYGIVRQMGGAVTVLSERNHGATFSVYLRASAADHGAKSAERPASGRVEGATPTRAEGPAPSGVEGSSKEA